MAHGAGAYRNILQKFIYNYSFETIDEHLSDANIGSRKNKNVRNHSFIVNGVILETLRSKNKSTDIEILDLSRRLTCTMLASRTRRST